MCRWVAYAGPEICIEDLIQVQYLSKIYNYFKPYHEQEFTP